jgi:hypothetical protein
MSINIRSFASKSEESDNVNSFNDPNGLVKREWAGTSDNIAEGYQESDTMKHWDLPLAFGSMETTKKGEKKSYWCDVCLLQLNSDDTMTSHMKGAKHLKKMQTFEENKYARGEDVDPSSYIRPIASTKPPPKKIPTRLQAKLRETQDALVGLVYITETIACSNPEMEPYYECTLCGNQGEANGMVSHLRGKGHREKFLRKMEPNNPKVLIMRPDQVKKEVEKHRENGNLSNIQTIYSDEMYPWPSGKAPWSAERGGTGIPPTGARNSVRLVSTFIKRDVDGKAKDENIGQGGSASVRVTDLPTVKTAEDLEAVYETVKGALAHAVNFHKENLKHDQDATEVSTLQRLVLGNLDLLSAIGVKESLYADPPGRLPSPAPIRSNASTSSRRSRSRSSSRSRTYRRPRSGSRSRTQSPASPPPRRYPRLSRRRSRSRSRTRSPSPPPPKYSRRDRGGRHYRSRERDY